VKIATINENNNLKQKGIKCRIEKKKILKTNCWIYSLTSTIYFICYFYFV